MGDAEIREFLTHLAVDRQIAPATQNQALAAILFLFHRVLRKQVGFVEGIVHSKASRKLPVVLAPDEVRRILDRLTGPSRLCAVLMYGSGLRVLEAASLRVKDVDFARSEITVRAGGGKATKIGAFHSPKSRRQPLAVSQGYTDDRRPSSSPLSSVRHPARVCNRGSGGSDHQARDVPLAETLIRHPFIGGRNGHSDHPGATRALRSANDDDLHSRAEPGSDGVKSPADRL